MRGHTSDPGTSRKVLLGGAVSIVVILTIGLVVTRINAPPADSTATATRTLATEQTPTLPKGSDFFSVIELSQPPGAELGPHAHPYFGYAYGLKGVATIAFDNATTRVAPGEVGFIGIQAAHAHQNTEDRVPSAALAVLIVALAAAVCLLSRRAARGDRRLLPIALVLLFAAGTLGAIDPWANDWLFVSIRSTTGRGAPMPLATSSRIYESPDFGPLVQGPFTETFEEITVAPAGTTEIGSVGASLLFVLDGQVEMQPALGSSINIATRGATLLQPAASAQLSNVGDRPAHVLEVTVVPAPTG